MDVLSYAEDCAAKGLRGDYSVCRDDFTVDPGILAYDSTDDEVWRTLFARQSRLAGEHGHAAFLDGLRHLDVGDGVPRFDAVNSRLQQLTGWTLVPVPGLIPAEPFFKHLSQRRFPVTHWLRPPAELDYIVEPDLFHDFFGHVPLLSLPVFADYMQLYGETALKAIDLGGVDMITRLYWYTAEFGLIAEAGQALKAYGAGLMSSAGELPHAVSGPNVRRRPAEIETIMRTGYEIDRYQRVYFVLPSFEALFKALDGLDLKALTARHATAAPIDPETL